MPRETLKNFLEDWKQTLLLHADIKDQLALHNEKGAARDAKKLRKHASRLSALLKAMPSTEKHGSDEMFCIFDWTSFIEEGA